MRSRPGKSECKGLPGTPPYTQLSLALSQPNETFTKAVFNIDATATTGTVDFSIFEPNGQNSQIGGFFVGNGLNLFTIESIGGQSIRSISITVPSGIDLVNQIRIGGFARDGSSTSVPDTGSTIVMLGGVLAVIGRARLRRKP